MSIPLDIIARLINQTHGPAQEIDKDLTGIAKAADVGAVNTDKLKKSWGGFVTAIAPATAAVGLLGVGLAYSIGQAAEAEVANAALEQTVKSMGGASGLTAEQLREMAGGLQAVTTFGDETIMRAESLLLTFGNINSTVFPETLELSLDMAQVFGSIDAAAIGVGKALNSFDGFTALKRQGVSFSETQIALIAGFKETGDMAGYQELVLKTLSEQFGGQARAAAETYTGRIAQLKNQFGEMGESVGMAVIPQLTELGEQVLPVVIANAERLADVADNQLSPAFTDLVQVSSELSELLSGGGIGVDIWQGLGNEIAEVNQELLKAQAYIELIKRPREARWGLIQEFADVDREAENAAEAVEGYRIVLDRLDVQQGEMNRKAGEGAEKFRVLAGAYDYMIDRSIALETSTELASGAYDYMILVAERSENAMETYGETLDSTRESGEEWAATLNTIMAGAMERTGDSISTITGLYGELEEAGGEWVTTTITNSGRIAAINEQLMADLDEDTKKGYQEILNTAVEGGAEWLAAYAGLQGDLTQAQRNELVARLADLQAHSGETVSVFTGDAEAVEEIQAAINEEWAKISEGHRQMVVDILVQQAEMEGGFNQSIANVMVATGLMTQDEARLQLSLRETGRQIGLVGDALIETFLEDGSVSRAEAALLEEAIAGIESGAFTAGEVLGAMATDDLGAFISQAEVATDRAGSFLDQMLELEGDYDVNVNTNYTESGSPPTIPGGGSQPPGPPGGDGPFQSGGYTGYGPMNEIAGYVHRQEYVLNAAAVNRVGLSNLEAINSGRPVNTAGDTYVTNNYLTFNIPGATPDLLQQVRREVGQAMEQAGRTADGYRRTR